MQGYGLIKFSLQYSSNSDINVAFGLKDISVHKRVAHHKFGHLYIFFLLSCPVIHTSSKLHCVHSIVIFCDYPYPIHLIRLSSLHRTPFQERSNMQCKSHHLESQGLMT